MSIARHLVLVPALAAAFSSLTLCPGEIRAFEIVWNQKDASGRQVPAGEYAAQARFPLVVLRIRESAGGLTATERAETIARRLRRMFEEGLTPRQLRVGAVEGEVAIVWRDQLLLTVDANHARLNRTTPLALARLWRQSLVESLSP